MPALPRLAKDVDRLGDNTGPPEEGQILGSTWPYLSHTHRQLLEDCQGWSQQLGLAGNSLINQFELHQLLVCAK